MAFLNKGSKILLVSLMLIGVSCASSNNTKDYDKGSLSYKINQLDGVRVTGSGQYQKVMVSSRKMSDKRFEQGWSAKAHGGASTSRKNPPLFVIDGQQAGRDFQKVIDKISGRKIDSVNIMSKNNAYSQYRRESYYGVIEITTKKDEPEAS